MKKLITVILILFFLQNNCVYGLAVPNVMADNKKDVLEQLPQEMWGEILNYLEMEDLPNIVMIQKYIYEKISEDKYFWEMIFERNFGNYEKFSKFFKQDKTKEMSMMTKFFKFKKMLIDYYFKKIKGSCDEDKLNIIEYILFDLIDSSNKYAYEKVWEILVKVIKTDKRGINGAPWAFTTKLIMRNKNKFHQVAIKFLKSEIDKKVNYNKALFEIMLRDFIIQAESGYSVDDILFIFKNTTNIDSSYIKLFNKLIPFKTITKEQKTQLCEIIETILIHKVSFTNFKTIIKTIIKFNIANESIIKRMFNLYILTYKDQQRFKNIILNFFKKINNDKQTKIFETMVQKLLSKHFKEIKIDEKIEKVSGPMILESVFARKEIDSTSKFNILELISLLKIKNANIEKLLINIMCNEKQKSNIRFSTMQAILDLKLDVSDTILSMLQSEKNDIRLLEYVLTIIREQKEKYINNDAIKKLLLQRLYKEYNKKYNKKIKVDIYDEKYHFKDDDSKKIKVDIYYKLDFELYKNLLNTITVLEIKDEKFEKFLVDAIINFNKKKSNISIFCAYETRYNLTAIKKLKIQNKELITMLLKSLKEETDFYKTHNLIGYLLSLIPSKTDNDNKFILIKDSILKSLFLENKDFLLPQNIDLIINYIDKGVITKDELRDKLIVMLGDKKLESKWYAIIYGLGELKQLDDDDPLVQILLKKLDIQGNYSKGIYFTILKTLIKLNKPNKLLNNKLKELLEKENDSFKIKLLEKAVFATLSEDEKTKQKKKKQDEKTNLSPKPNVDNILNNIDKSNILNKIINLENISKEDKKKIEEFLIKYIDENKMSFDVFNIIKKFRINNKKLNKSLFVFLKNEIINSNDSKDTKTQKKIIEFIISIKLQDNDLKTERLIFILELLEQGVHGILSMNDFEKCVLNNIYKYKYNFPDFSLLNLAGDYKKQFLNIIFNSPQDYDTKIIYEAVLLDDSFKQIADKISA